MYHKVYPESPTMWWVTADDFWRQMEELRRYEVVYLDDYDPSNPKQAVITFDGVYENIYIYALPILKKFGYPFELFIVGESIGKDNRFDQPVEPQANFCNVNQLKSMVQAGGRLQWHSHTHCDLSAVSNPDLRERELHVPENLKNIDRDGLKWFAYPHGRHNEKLIEEVKALYSGALSCVAGNDYDRFQLNRITVTNETTFKRSTVSLIIANYNYGRFLPEAAYSALSQTVQPDEILLIDDCSIDNSMEVAERYKDKMKVVRNEKNLGIVENFNKAVSLTKGDYICFLGADNRFRSDYIEKCKLALDTHEDAAVAYTDAVLFGQRAEVLAQKVNAEPVPNIKDTFLWQFVDFNEDTKKTLRQQNFIHGSSMYRRIAFEKVCGYLKSDGPEDHNLFVRMIDHGWNAIHVPEYLLEYRQHSNEQANTQLNYSIELAYYRRQLKTTLKQNKVLREKINSIQKLSSGSAEIKGNVTLREDLEIITNTIKQGKIDDALQIITASLRKFPEQSRLLYYYALVLSSKGDIEGAESALKHSLYYDPSFSTAYNDLGVICFKLGKKDEALRYYHRAAETDPPNINALKNLADFYYVETGDLEKAVQVYLKILISNPEDIETLLALGHICLVMNRLEDARSFYQKVLVLDPHNAHARESMTILENCENDGTSSIAEWMKNDWNKRAVENAHYYVHSTAKDQTEEEFDVSGKESVRVLISDDLKIITSGKDPKSMKVLEIGCGIGRMTKYMAEIFGEVHGVDISCEMIQRAQERLKNFDNVYLYETNGKDLSVFENDMFDFIFSFIVFQHIPSKDIIINCIQEAYRVLKTNGIFKFQVQGTINPEWLKQKKDTWHGDTVTYEDISEISAQLGFEILSNHGQGTQYSWYTLKKREIPSYKTFVPGLVSIVIPVFNKLSYTQKCLEFLKKNTPAEKYEVIVVDNASSDGTSEFLQSLGNMVCVITNTVNMGFTKACNQGAKISNGEYVLFLNNDTEPQLGWLEKLIEVVESSKDIGIVGSKLVYPDGRLQEAGGIIFNDGSGWNFGKFDDPAKPLYNYVREVDYVSGASLLIRKSILEKLNYFDEQYSPGYYEDTDLCFGVRAIEYKVMYCPFSVVVHHEGISSGTDLSQGMKKYQVINKGKFVQKWKEQLSQQCAPSSKNVMRASERNVEGNILIIDPFLPLFDRASGALRLFTIISFLKEQGYHITYIARNGQGQESYTNVLRHMGLEVYATDPEKLRQLGYTVNAEEIDLKKIFSERTFDFAYLSFYEIALQYLGDIRKYSPDTKIIIDTVDIHFIREIRRAELEKDSKLLKKANKIKEEELFIYNKADAIITVTEKDWEHIKDYLPGKRNFVIPNIHSVDDIPLKTDNRTGLLFIGNFNHLPNQDAVKYFVKDIYPLIKERISGISFTVVGNNPPKEILDLQNDGITVTGYVPSTEPYLKNARVSIAPLRYGAGMKGKIGEAMAHGLPVVTTTIGAEGIGIIAGETALIADSAQGFAEHVIRLCVDDHLWYEVAHKGRAFIREHYSKEKVSEQLTDMLKEISSLKTDRLTDSPGSGPEKVEKGLASIVILTLNELRYTKECLESIKKHTPEPYEIIFVDNGSTDGTVKWIKHIMKDDSHYKLIENKKNLGFPKGCNQGIQASSGEYILLLNNDVIVTDGWLSGMLECLNSSPDVGIVGPMTDNISGIQKVPADYGSLNRLDDYARAFRELNRYRRVPARRIVGFCMFFTRKLVEKIGLLDESFGSGNFEDDDYCIRAALEGYRNIIAGDVFIHHYGSRSFIGNRIDYSSAMAQNKKIFRKKWNGIDAKGPLGKNLLSLKAMETADHLSQKGLIEKAVKKFLEGIKISPDEKSIYFALSEMLIAEKQFKDALDVLQGMPVIDENPLRLVLIGYCKEGLELYQEAEEYATRVLSLEAEYALALNLKGILEYRKGNNSAAEDFFQKAIESDQSFGEPYTNLGVLKWSNGEREKALNLMERGFILSPTIMDMAIIYHSAVTQLKLFDRGERIFKSAKDLYPFNRRLAFFLIDILIQQGKNGTALHEIQEAMIKFDIDDGIISAALEVRNRIAECEIENIPGNKITLSLCMIVKNEERHLARCLMSVKALVDEMVVIDTGSTDRTKDIAKIFGAKVYDFEWANDFSQARNFSILKASGEWILVLDADEVISAQDSQVIKDIVRRKGKTVAYSLITRNYVNEMTLTGWTPNDGRYSDEEAGSGWFPSKKVRLFPNDSRIQFENPVHELVESSLDRAGIKIKECKVPIHHYGKLNTKKIIAKGEDYYLLGKAKLSEKDDDTQALFELAVQATELRKYDEALELWQRFLSLEVDIPKPFLTRAYLNMGGAYLQLGRYEEALSSSKKAMEIDPDLKEAVINYALSELCIGDIKKVINALEDLLSKDPEYVPAIAMLSSAYCIDNNIEKGLEHLKEIKIKGVNYADYLYEYAKMLASSGKVEQAIVLIDAAIDSNTLNKNILTLLSECYKRTKN